MCPPSVVYQGLSPRVRGNRQVGGCKECRVGSIPARAGKPRPVVGQQDFPGSIPRVRGNPGEGAAHVFGNGSIPARAGKPQSWGAPSRMRRVYPRACGETQDCRDIHVDQKGLSPRVRGNPRAVVECDIPIGSIPARAGKPCSRAAFETLVRVYPRACGETGLNNVLNVCREGLSPRVRGNPHGGRDHLRGSGSIPARAGKPFQSVRLVWDSGVYPRACGETDQGRQRSV